MARKLNGCIVIYVGDENNRKVWLTEESKRWALGNCKSNNRKVIWSFTPSQIADAGYPEAAEDLAAILRAFEPSNHIIFWYGIEQMVLAAYNAGEQAGIRQKKKG